MMETRVSDPYKLYQGVNGEPDAEIPAAVMPPATHTSRRRG